MVHVIAHRGWWTTPAEQNTPDAFRRAFDAGIGVELDVRDREGRLVVSHDPPEYGLPSLLFGRVLEILGDRPNVLAVNVKSCGLAPWFAELKAPKNWFFFDTAPGDEGEYQRHRLPLYERDVWQADPVLLVSWEVLFKGSDNKAYWNDLKKGPHRDRNILLVTDLPREALEFFK